MNWGNPRRGVLVPSLEEWRGKFSWDLLRGGIEYIYADKSLLGRGEVCLGARVGGVPIWEENNLPESLGRGGDAERAFPNGCLLKGGKLLNPVGSIMFRKVIGWLCET